MDTLQPAEATDPEGGRRLVFGRRYGVHAFWAVLIAVCGGVFCWQVALPGEVFMMAKGGGLLSVTAAAVAASVVVIAILGSLVVVVDDRGMTMCLVWLAKRVSKPAVPWDRVRDVRVPAVARWLLGPSLLLVVEAAPGRRITLGRPGRRVVLHSVWADHERLFAEVLKRLPHIELSQAVIDHLRTLHEVTPWQRRAVLAAAAWLAGSLCLAAYESVQYGAMGLPTAVAVFAGVNACKVFGGVPSRDWPWKSTLLSAGTMLALLALTLYFFSGLMPAAASYAMCLAVAGSAGWAVVSCGVCLPGRWTGRRAATAYAVAVVAALALAWHLGVREPLPYRETMGLDVAGSALQWSPDGRLIAAETRVVRERVRAVGVVDADAGAARLVPSIGLRGTLSWADERHVLFVRSRSTSQPQQLVLLDLWTSQFKTLLRATAVRLARTRCLSPDGARVAVLADEGGTRSLRLIRLADGSVEERETGLDTDQLSSVHWRPDGSLLLMARRRDREDGSRVALWALGPAGGPATPLYEAEAPWMTVDLSPDARWAVVGHDAVPPPRDLLKISNAADIVSEELFADWDTIDRCEIVDLRTGERHPLYAPLPRRVGPIPYWLASWSADGRVFAYSALDDNGYMLVHVDPRTGRAAPLHRIGGGRLVWVALSAHARYAACLVRRGPVGRTCIVDLATGRATSLRRAHAWPFVWQGAWSPLTPTLAVSFLTLIPGEIGALVRMVEVNHALD